MTPWARSPHATSFEAADEGWKCYDDCPFLFDLFLSDWFIVLAFNGCLGHVSVDARRRINVSVRDGVSVWVDLLTDSQSGCLDSAASRLHKYI